jgi:catechol 2,3-dioxygenase-like lactoylglutathione lyase family enzyme
VPGYRIGGPVVGCAPRAVRIRQVAIAVRSLEPAVEMLCDVLGLEVAYRDPGVEVFGLENAVLPVGETFLEVLSPIREGTSAGRFLDRRGGDAGYMVIVQTDDLEKDRRRVEELGVRVVWEIALEDAATIHLHPRDVGGALLSLDAMRPSESWRWAGPRWREHVRTERVRGIVGVELEAIHPERLAARWARILSRSSRPGAAGAWRVALEGGALRFVRGRDEGLRGIVLEATDVASILAHARARGLPSDARGITCAGVRLELSGPSVA